VVDVSGKTGEKKDTASAPTNTSTDTASDAADSDTAAPETPTADNSSVIHLPGPTLGRVRARLSRAIHYTSGEGSSSMNRLTRYREASYLTATHGMRATKVRMYQYLPSFMTPKKSPASGGIGKGFLIYSGMSSLRVLRRKW